MTKKNVKREDAAARRQSASTQKRHSTSTHQQETLPALEKAILPVLKSPDGAVLKSPGVLGKYFRHLFGTEDWGEAAPPPPYRSGPVPKSAGSLAQQRLADPEARFYYAVMMAEVMLLPICVAHSAGEKEKLGGEIAEILGLDIATEKGWIDSYLICWRAGSFPTSPTGVRVRTTEGRRTREQVLGSMETHIRRFVQRAQAGPYDPVNVRSAQRGG